MTLAALDLDDDIVLPEPPGPPARPTLPLFASIVPVVGALGLWAVTGSVLSLWFAALGPLIAAASLVDAARTARRARRRSTEMIRAALDDAERTIARRHSDERARLARRHPDAAAYVLGDAEPWRGGDAPLVIGRGATTSTVRTRGGAGDDAVRALRLRARRLEDAPVVLPPTGAVAVCGPIPLTAAVVRALVVQVCAAHPPSALRVVGSVQTGHWSAGLPHRRGAGARTLAFSEDDPTASTGTDLAIVAVPPGVEPPTASTVVRLTAPSRGELVETDGPRPIALESLSVDQAAAAVAELDRRAGRQHRDTGTAPVAFAELTAAPLARGGLAAAIGRSGGHPAIVDLVSDGPHAVVVGVTGAGKSELLATWVAGLCHGRDPDEVTVLLADFKGGTTFASLARLPHVAGVITDLDDGGARRAIESLRAEIRRREQSLTTAGARDVADPRAALGRLVVVVDEFAALLGAHPELQTVFADVAARGRALGMHLVLGTQRATGVIREGLLANCPLRIALRVTDPSDARMLLGAPDAASLPGDPASRGLAYVRRAGDDRPQLTRIALTSTADVARIAAGAGAAPAERPWLPDLPPSVTLDELDELGQLHGIAERPDSVGRGAGVRSPGDIVLGLADDPAAQRRHVSVLGVAERGILAVGGAGSGKTTLAALVAAQVPPRRLHLVPRDPEAAWDAVARLTAAPPEPGVVVVIDDADALATRFPPDHGREIADRLERLARDAGDLGIRIVATAQRPLGLAARLGELLPRRLVLGTASRAEHVAAGADAALYRPRAGAGRAVLDGLEVQLALPGTRAARRMRSEAQVAPGWLPDRLCGLVAREGIPAIVAACRERGVAARPVEEVAADERSPVGPLVIWGDPEAWQRAWRLLALVRGDGELLVDAGCASELRSLVGVRNLPPYCRPGAGRAWRVTPDGALARVTLPSTDSRSPARER